MWIFMVYVTALEMVKLVRFTLAGNKCIFGGV